MMKSKLQSDGDLAALMPEVIECLPNGFCIYDHEFRPVIANRIVRAAFQEFFAGIAGGLTYREAHFAEVRHAMRGATDDECWAIADRLIAHARQGKPIDMRARDGRIFRTIYRSLSGGCCVAVYIDISELRQRKAELERLRQQAEAANQAKSAFLANMSHEIRTPLNGILGMAQILAENELNAAVREQVEIILESGKTLKALLEDVLDLSKIESGHMELAPADCDLEQILRRQYRLWLPRAMEKGIGLNLEIAPDLPARLYLIRSASANACRILRPTRSNLPSAARCGSKSPHARRRARFSSPRRSWTPVSA